MVMALASCRPTLHSYSSLINLSTKCRLGLGGAGSRRARGPKLERLRVHIWDWLQCSVLQNTSSNPKKASHFLTSLLVLPLESWLLSFAPSAQSAGVRWSVGD
jgi:hypothetical protein